MKAPLVGMFIGFVWSALMFRSIFSASSEVIWADNFDGNLVYWILEWGFHVFVRAAEPWNFWNANIFHPLSNSLAVTESLLGAQIIYSPIRLLGVTAPNAIYVTLAITFVAGAFFTDFCALKLGFTDPVERFFLIVMSHCIMPNTMMLYHYQLFGFQFGPGFLLSLILFLDHPSKSSLSLTAGLYVLASCYSAYLAPVLLSLALPIICVNLVPKILKAGLRPVASRYLSPTFLVITAIFAAFLYVSQMGPYYRFSKAFGQTGWNESQTYAAYWHNLFTGKSKHSMWYGDVGYAYGDWERTQFLGYSVILILGACLLLLVFFRFVKKVDAKALWQPLIWFGFFIWIWSLSTGPYIRGTKMALPFKIISTVIPGLSSVRAPGRIAMLIGLPIAMLVIHLLRTQKLAWSHRYILLLATIGISVESLPNFKSEPLRRQNWPIYEHLSSFITPGSTLLEIPLAVGDNYGVIMNAMDQMKGSTLHWAKIVSGYGARSSASFSEALDIDQRAQKSEASPSEFFSFMSRNDFRYLLIHLDQINEPYAKEWRRVLKRCEACKVIVDRDYLLIDTAKNP